MSKWLFLKKLVIDGRALLKSFLQQLPVTYIQKNSSIAENVAMVNSMLRSAWNNLSALEPTTQATTGSYTDQISGFYLKNANIH